jgi:hypothetical protein
MVWCWIIALGLLYTGTYDTAVRGDRINPPLFISASYCFTNECYLGQVEELAREKKTVVALFTPNIRNDPFLPLYVGWLMSLFEYVAPQTQFLISQTNESYVQVSPGIDDTHIVITSLPLLQDMFEMIQHLSPGTILVCHEKGTVTIKYCIGLETAFDL